MYQYNLRLKHVLHFISIAQLPIKIRIQDGINNCLNMKSLVQTAHSLTQF